MQLIVCQLYLIKIKKKSGQQASKLSLVPRNKSLEAISALDPISSITAILNGRRRRPVCPVPRGEHCGGVRQESPGVLLTRGGEPINWTNSVSGM